MRRSFLIFTALLALIALLGALITDQFALQILTLTLIWATAGLAWNVPATAGQISLGHAAFTGIGAYGFVFCVVQFGWSAWVGMAVSMAAAAVLALVIGLPTFRLQGFYFTLATMAFPLILMVLVIAGGHPEVTVPFNPGEPIASMQFRDPRSYVWLALGAFAVVGALCLAVAESKIGRTLIAIRDNEILARSVGVRTLVWKLGAFCFSAAVSAAVGVIWVNAILLVVAAEEVFGFAVSILLISVTFVGGIGRFWGPIVGAGLLIPLSQFLTVQVGDRVPGAESIVYGLALVAVALVMPRGVFPTIADRLTRRGADGPPDEHRTDNAEWRALAREAKATSSDDVLLEVIGVEKRYGGLTVLRDATFTVGAGARLGLIGPNGAGKTTLFNLMTGHATPNGGSIRFRGEDITKLPAPARTQLGLSRTFQVPQGFRSMTARQNVEIAALGSGLGPAEADRHTRAILCAVGLGGRADRLPSALTAFELKLLELARAAVSRPAVLLLDEPLAGLNEAERGDFFAALDLVVDEEIAVVVIEHSVKALLSYSSELLALDGGQIIASGSPRVVVRDPRVIKAYLGNKFAARYSLVSEPQKADQP